VSFYRTKKIEVDLFLSETFGINRQIHFSKLNDKLIEQAKNEGRM